MPKVDDTDQLIKDYFRGLIAMRITAITEQIAYQLKLTDSYTLSALNKAIESDERLKKLHQQKSIVEQALANFPEAEKICLLRYGESHYQQWEIAEELHLSRGTLWKRYKELKRMINKKIKQ